MGKCMVPQCPINTFYIKVKIFSFIWYYKYIYKEYVKEKPVFVHI